MLSNPAGCTRDLVHSKGSRVAIVVFDEFIDRVVQLSNTGQVGSLQGLAAQDTKPNLNLIEPGGAGRSELRSFRRAK